MTVRDGKAYLEGLNDGREVWYDGERVDDVRSHPAFKSSVATVAGLYDMQHDPAYRDVLTYECPELGERVHWSLHIPRTVEDLHKRREAYACWARATCGMMGRSGDFLNTSLTGIAANSWFFGEHSAERAQVAESYHRFLKQTDPFLTHALVDPQLDKGKLRHEQEDPGTCLRVVGRSDGGLIVSGAKRIATAAPYAHEILVWPFPPTFQPGEEPYANVFAIPMNTPGLKTICRASFANNGERRDFPLSSRFEEMDATVVFDDVLVPWDRVFLHENIDLLNRMYKEVRIREMTALQTNTRLEVKLSFLYAVIVRMAQAAGIENRPATMEMLGEAATYVEIVRNSVRAAEAQATVDPRTNVIYPDLAALQVGRVMGTKVYPAMLEMLKKIGGGGLVQLPVTMDEFNSPIGADIDRYLSGSGWSGQDKAQLFKLAWDLCGSEFGSRHELYEINYAGDPAALRASAHREYSRKEQHLAFLDDFLEAL